MTTRRDTTRARTRPLACVVVNPSKPAATDAVRRRITTSLRNAGYVEPVWLETTPAEPGVMQARLAVASGASLVVAAGGDGTVRAGGGRPAPPPRPHARPPPGPAPPPPGPPGAPLVRPAGAPGRGRPGPPATARTGVDMAILPLGTANLAARNLGLPIGRLEAALEVAAHGTARPADLAWVSTEPGGASLPAPPGGWARPTLGSEHVCMVVAGIGFDAGLVASTRPELKARIRWGAYAVAAVANLDSPHMDMVVRVRETDGGERVERLRGRTVLVANGGRLPAGITLLREARMDDGVLDVAVIDTVGGVAGWSSLARQVLPPFAATYSDPARALGRVTLRRGTEAIIRLTDSAPVQVDGELIAPTRGLRARMDAGSLLVRRPD